MNKKNIKREIRTLDKICCVVNAKIIDLLGRDLDMEEREILSDYEAISDRIAETVCHLYDLPQMEDERKAMAMAKSNDLP